MFYRTKQAFREGQWYQASADSPLSDEPQTGAVVAMDPANGETRWRYEMLTQHSSGLLTTGGGLVFIGDPQGYFTALDARSGKPLWSFQAGGNLGAPPITYTLNGRQQIAVAAGSSIITFQLVNGK